MPPPGASVSVVNCTDAWAWPFPPSVSVMNGCAQAVRAASAAIEAATAIEATSLTLWLLLNIVFLLLRIAGCDLSVHPTGRRQRGGKG